MRTPDAALHRAREAHAARLWAEAVDDFEAAGGFDGLEPADLERYVWSLTWTGPPSAMCLDAFERLETAHHKVGDHRGAARAALEQSRMNALIGSGHVAASCWARAIEHLGEDEECPEFGLAHALAAYAQLIAGDLEGVTGPAEVARRVGQRVGDPTVQAMAEYVIGQQRLLTDASDEGMRLLDGSISIALHRDAHLMYAGIIYCGVLWACRLVGDWSRAMEWHEVATRWCERENIVHFPAHLHVHRAELERVRGRFGEAERWALAALDEAGDWSRDLVAWALHQLGEVRLCLGDLAEAEAAFSRVDGTPFPPEPGRSRLLLMRGRPEAALRSITHAIENTNWYALSGQIYTLPVGVSVALTLGRIDLASQWCARLDALAVRYGTPGPSSAAEVARGELAHAQGHPADAVERLTEGTEGWLRTGAPYDAACARVLLARAYAASEDLDQARLELAGARSSFSELGAASDRDRVDRFVSGAHELLEGLEAEWSAEADTPLTPRQREVAALVARGYSNQQIADDLVVSRYTAETHVKHILSRLGFSSRSEIAAWAAERGLTQ